MLLLKAETCNNHWGISQDFREGVRMLFNAFPPTFCESGRMYEEGNCHEAKTLLWSKIHVFSANMHILFRPKAARWTAWWSASEYPERHLWFPSSNLFKGERCFFNFYFFHKLYVPDIYLDFLQAHIPKLSLKFL